MTPSLPELVRSTSCQNGAMRGGETRGKSLGGQQLAKVASNDNTPLEFTYKQNTEWILLKSLLAYIYTCHDSVAMHELYRIL